MPGTLAVIGFVLAIMVYVRLFPGEGAAHEGLPWREKIRSIGGVWHILLLFMIVLGGIYGGFFTPTEGAAVGVFLVIALGFVTRSLSFRALIKCMTATAVTTAMIYAIVFGADLFNVALALTRLPHIAAEWLSGTGAAPMTVLILLILFYMIMGCVMDSLSMILLTIPVFFPAFMGLDFGMTPDHQAMWFGILTLIVVELGMITPPVGLNLFVISAMAPDIPTKQVFAGAVPFIGARTVARRPDRRLSAADLLVGRSGARLTARPEPKDRT